MAKMVETVVAQVGRMSGGHVAVLRERHGERSVGIGVGAHPARWLSAHLAHIRMARPNTYALSLRVIEQLGGRLARVTIDDNREPEPSAYLEVDGPAGLLEIGCSVEDAIALASYGGVPILVHPGFFAAGRRRGRLARPQGPAEPGDEPPAGEGEPPPPSAPPPE